MNADLLERNLWTDRYVPAVMKTDGRTAPVMLRYRGGHTREYPKRSYDIVRDGETYHYNAEFDDPSLIRNALSFAFFGMIGVPAPRTKHVLLRRNNENLGVYLEIESVGKRFFKKRGIGASSLFYAVNEQANFSEISPDSGRSKSSMLAGYEFKFGSTDEKTRFERFLLGIHRTDPKETAAFIERHLDVDNYLRWLAGAVLTGNYDGFEQNYAVYRHTRSGKYRMIPWDYEGTWGRNCYGQIVDSDTVSVTGHNRLTEKLLKHRNYRREYGGILRDALKGPFTERKMMPIADRMLSKVAPYMKKYVEDRWTYDDFLCESDLIRKYIRERRSIVKRELEKRF
ncbi:spore coat protein CotH [Cohnella pontilimi]|uniref:Spore coat protein CotH n=2 Tax=Cohnella pontilimi TaxID=2564100 RepID=A0A4U0FAN5_9BACL|nr:spore coat protein CotH [Cohnella pontilimi]